MIGDPGESLCESTSIKHAQTSIVLEFADRLITEHAENFISILEQARALLGGFEVYIVAVSAQEVACDIRDGCCGQARADLTSLLVCAELLPVVQQRGAGR